MKFNSINCNGYLMKYKLLSLCIVSSLFFVGCSKTTNDESTSVLVNDTVDIVNIVDDIETVNQELQDESQQDDLQQIEKLVEEQEVDINEVVINDNKETPIINDEIDTKTIIEDTDITNDDEIKFTVESTNDLNNSNQPVELTTSIDDEIVNILETEEIVPVVEEVIQTDIFIEPVIEVLEAYIEVDEEHHSLNYNLTGNIDIESHVFDQVNELRLSLGIAPLTTNNILVGAAYTRSKEQVEIFSHTRPNGASWYTIFEEIPYRFRACGENLTTGSGLTREQAYHKIFDSWYNSPGHYSNMVNPDFKEIGIAVHFDDNGTYYATQIFGTEFD